MAYTDSFDTVTPAGTDLMSLGDDAIRKLARAITERLQSIIVDTDADPMVIKDSAKVPADGSITAVKLDPAIGLAKIISTVDAFTAALAAHTGSTPGDVSLPGAVVGDLVLIGASSDTTALVLSAFVPAPDTVRYSVFNSNTVIANVTTNIKLAIVKSI